MTKINKTIVFYIATLTRGGAERVMVSLANAFAKQGDKVILVTLEPDEGLYEIDENIQHIVLDFSKEGRIASALGRITAVRKLVKENNADALVGFIGKTNIRTILAGFGTKARTIVSVRSTPEREYKGIKNTLIAKLVFPLADGVVFQTEAAKNFFGKIVQKKSCVLPNPLSTAFVDAYVARNTIADNNSVRRVVTVGRMDPVKNHELLVRAFKLVLERIPNLTLSIYGDGECREQIRGLGKNLGIDSKLHLPGDVKNVKDQIKDASLFVLSSNFEGMPNAIAEAQAMGIPVVSTDCPNGARALVTHEKTGMLVPVGDEKQMAEAIIKVLSDNDLADRLSRQGYEFAQNLYPDVVHSRWRDFIYMDDDK